MDRNIFKVPDTFEIIERNENRIKAKVGKFNLNITYKNSPSEEAIKNFNVEFNQICNKDR